MRKIARLLVLTLVSSTSLWLFAPQPASAGIVCHEDLPAQGFCCDGSLVTITVGGKTYTVPINC